MVLRYGIEPHSDAYKTPASPAMLTELKLECRVGFEPTVLRICNPTHWAALPPTH
jgi:hypothetical protein